MPLPERPQIFPTLNAAPDQYDPRFWIVWDRLGSVDGPLRVSSEELFWVRLFDGRRTLRDVQAEAMRRGGGQLSPLERFAALAQKLADARLLDGPLREPACVGCYEGEPAALRRQLRGLFTHERGSGLPGEPRPDGRLRAALLPHMDYHRGGLSYTWGFREVFEQADAALFVIVGTSHQPVRRRYTLTRKDFKTPLGTVPTDQDYIDRLVRHYGDGLFDDEWAHRPEHSIELEVVFLQYLYENRRPFRIVPLVVGSFQDSVAAGSLPSFRPDVGRMVEALRRAEAETPEPICYIISGDLAHLGPKFEDPEPVSEALLEHSRAQDRALLAQAEAADPAGYFGVVAAERDRRRTCGLPPTYTVLEAARPGRGRVLHYDRYVHPHGFESVSFASMAFYR